RLISIGRLDQAREAIDADRIAVHVTLPLQQPVTVILSLLRFGGKGKERGRPAGSISPWWRIWRPLHARGRRAADALLADGTEKKRSGGRDLTRKVDVRAIS